MTNSPLDEAVYAASKELRGRGAPDPEVLFFMGTGLGLLPASLAATWSLSLEGISGVPAAWRGATLVAGEAAGATFWFLEDSPGELSRSGNPRDEPAWARSFPVWLAACSGATICVYTSAGRRLAGAAKSPLAPLALGKDHINLSGEPPLLALGESRLGALFPDQSTLHPEGLRRMAHGRAAAQGLETCEAVLACSAGPAMETPAEAEFFARAGAEVVVQDLAGPLIAAAHSGLAALSVVALLDPQGESLVESLLEGAEALAPALEELLVALVPDLAVVALELREDF